MRRGLQTPPEDHPGTARPAIGSTIDFESGTGGTTFTVGIPVVSGDAGLTASSDSLAAGESTN